MLAEVIMLLGKLPGELVQGILGIIRAVSDAPDGAAQRAAVDAAAAAAEKALLERSFPKE